MGFPATVAIQRRTEAGGWDDYRSLWVTLEQIAKPDMPPRGGHRFACKESEGVRPGMRATVGAGGKPWDVLHVEPGDTAGTVNVLLGTRPDGETVASDSPAGRAPVAVQCRAVFRDADGREAANILVERAGDTLALLHDYPDFAPLPGWTAHGRGFGLRITTVDGKTLTCEPLEI